MVGSKKIDGNNPNSAKKPAHGLRVPLPAVLVGLGMLASATQQVEAASAVNDSYAVQAGSTLSGVNILSNDVFDNSNSFTVVAGSASSGIASVDGVGNLTYTPNPGFSGSDSFSYELTDIVSNSVAQVNILVSPVPTPVPALESAALVGLSGLLAAFGLRRRRD